MKYPNVFVILFFKACTPFPFTIDGFIVKTQNFAVDRLEVDICFNYIKYIRIDARTITESVTKRNSNYRKTEIKICVYENQYRVLYELQLQEKNQLDFPTMKIPFFIFLLARLLAGNVSKTN